MPVTVKPMIAIPADGRRLRAAIFLSGEGSNAERLLAGHNLTASGWEPVVLVTDRPETSRARLLAAQFDVPLIEHDIREFYRRRGETGFGLGTPAGRRLRLEWTDELRRLLAPFRVDFGILAGFVPLCNIAADFPCLNVHPGDLTYLRDGQRYLVGLHHLPVERAILAGLSALRSSVIVAQPYTGQGEEMDSGPLLGISPPVALDLQGHSREELEQLFRVRPERKPAGGYGDALERLAVDHLERLKRDGDWVVFPAVVGDFAAGRFGFGPGQKLLFRDLRGEWLPVSTVEYGSDGTGRPLPL